MKIPSVITDLDTKLEVIPVTVNDLLKSYPNGSEEMISLLYEKTLKYNFCLCSGQPNRAQVLLNTIKRLTNKLLKKEIQNV